MRKILCAMTAGIAASAFAGTQLQVEPTWAPDAFGGYASTHIVVKFHPYIEPGDNAYAELATLQAKWNVQEVRKAVNFRMKHPELAAKHGLDRYYIMDVPEGTDTFAMMQEFALLSDLIEVVEVDGIGGVAETIPNDTDFALQYGVHNTGQVIQGEIGVVDADIDGPEAWDLHTGSSSVRLAVVDSGVNAHTDFGGRLITGWNTVLDNDVQTTDFDCPHGTHVAGIAGALGNNAAGVAGVNWGVTLQSVKVLTGCSGVETDCGEGLIWAADNGANICTMSLQYYTGIAFFNDAVNYAHDAGLLLIAATGNNQGRNVAYPAKFENCMGIGATTNEDTIAGFSNYGPEVDVSAPGENVYATYYPNTYAYLSGTSMATPHTSGLASLIWSYNPNLTNEDVRDILMQTADDLGPAGWDERYGWGRINAFAALQLAPTGPSEPDPIDCADVVSMTARCRGRTLRVIVNMADDTHNGQNVSIDVSGVIYQARVASGRAVLLAEPGAGEHTITIADPAGCGISAVTATCLR